MFLGQQPSYHGRLPGRNSPLLHPSKDARCSDCRLRDSGTDFTKYHLTTCPHQQDFSPSSNRFSLLAEPDRSPAEPQWSFDFTPPLPGGAKRRCKRAGKHQGLKTLAAKNPGGNQCEVVKLLWEMEALRLRNEAPDRTEQFDAADHGEVTVKDKLEAAFQGAKPYWAPQLRPDSQTPRSSSTRPMIASGQIISHNEAQPGTLPPTFVETPQVRESEQRTVQPEPLACNDTSGLSPSNTRFGEAVNLKETSQNSDAAIALASHAQNAVVAAACCALKVNGFHLTSVSPHKKSIARREGLAAFPPFMQAPSPSCYAPVSPAQLVATTIFTPASTHSTSVEEPNGHQKMGIKYEQSSLEETIVPLAGLGQTPRPGTFPSNIVVDGKVITFEPVKLGLCSPSDPPFICPWQRYPSSATDGRCTRSQSPFCIMANHHNNAAGICHPLGAAGVEDHGTPCWCLECLNSHKAAYRSKTGHPPPVQAFETSPRSKVSTPEPILVGESMDPRSTHQPHQSEILDLSSPITGNATTGYILTDADISMLNLGPAVTTANATTAPTTATSALVSTTLAQRPRSPILDDSSDPASNWPRTTHPISKATLPPSAKSMLNKPSSIITDSLRTIPSTLPRDINKNFLKVPKTQTRSNHSYGYSIVSRNAPKSLWDQTSHVSAHSDPMESLGFSIFDEDDGYDGNIDEELS